MVLGAGGMLGRAVVAAAQARRHRVALVTHGDCDVTMPADVFAAFNGYGITGPDAIINCAGAIPSRGYLPYVVAAVNGVAPHIVARYAADRRIWPATPPVIHVSTDCVFSGRPEARFPAWAYFTDDRPDPIDLYGRSKLAGEVDAPHVLNVRTSFVGPDHGLWAWFAAQPEGATVEGWEQAWWTGSTVQAVAAALVTLAEQGRTDLAPEERIAHLATANKINKYTALCLLREHLGLNVTITPTAEPWIDRALDATVVLPSLADALAVERTAAAPSAVVSS